MDMEQSCENFFDDAKVESGKFDFVDILPYGSNYFTCGYTPLRVANGCYYNHSIAVAFSLIGKIYGPKNNGTSNYHKGVTYIAQRVGVSKRQVKVLRKQFKAHGAYLFRTPYTIANILEVMIDLLEKNNSDELIVEYLRDKRDEMYREVLIGKKFESIEIAASQKVQVEKVKNVYNKLNCITKTVSRC